MIERYTRPAFATLWSEQKRLDTWLEIELLVCEALAGRGEIPVAAAQELRARATFAPARVREIEAVVHHDVIAFVSAVAETVGDAGRYLHLGLTSSDVVDTALAVLLRDAADLLCDDLRRLREAVRAQAVRHAHTAMIGRTHGIHAEPITLGLKLASWFTQLGRAARHLRDARREIAVGKLSGAVGTFANVAPEVEATVLARLGLAPEPIATQVVARDRHAFYFSALALVAATVERIALEIRHLQRTEVGELQEPFGTGQKGSSAMPHKRNPILSENLCGLARLVRGYAATALENVALWHERDISHSAVERVIAPDATTALDFMLARLTGVIEGLVVHPDRMAQNLSLLGGAICSEHLLLTLVRRGAARDDAYRWIQRHALASTSGKPEALRDAVRSDPDIARHLRPEEVDGAFDLEHHLRHVDTLLARALAADGGDDDDAR
jgi:adenylosuccinate lyase